MRAGRRSTAATNHKMVPHLKHLKVITETSGDRLGQIKAEFQFVTICLFILRLLYH